MSATAARQQSHAEPAPPPSPGARRVTGASLMRRVLSVPDNSRNLRNWRLVPIGGALVLRAVANLVAGSDDLVYRIDPRLDPDGLPGAVALELKGRGGDDDIARILDGLRDADLIDVTDGEIRLNMPPLPAPADAAPAAYRADLADGPRPRTRLGAPRKGETDAEYKARLEAARAAARAWDDQQALRSGQRSLALPIAGGRRGADLPADFGRDVSERHKSRPDFRVISDEPTSEVGAGTSAPRAEKSEDDEDDRTSISESSSSSDLSAGARDDLSPTSEVEISEVGISEVATSADISAGRSPADISAPSAPLAQHLGGEIAAALDLTAPRAARLVRDLDGLIAKDPRAAEELPGIAGLVIEQHRKQRADGRAGVSDPGGYLARCLEARLRAPPAQPAHARVAGSGGSPAAQTASHHPEVAANPVWAAQPWSTKHTISRMLECQAMPAAERRRILSSRRQTDPEAYRLVALTRPDLVLEEDRPEPEVDNDDERPRLVGTA